MEAAAARGSGKMQYALQIGKHQLLTDISEVIGTKTQGCPRTISWPALLAACVCLAVTMYANRKGMALRDIHVRITHGDKDGAYELNRFIEHIGT